MQNKSSPWEWGAALRGQCPAPLPVPAGLCRSAALRSPWFSMGCWDTLSLLVSLGFLIFKTAALLQRLMLLVTQQPLPSRLEFHAGEQRCPRQNPPCAASPPRARSAGGGPASSSLPKAGPEPGAAMEAGQVLRCNESPQGQTLTLRLPNLPLPPSAGLLLTPGTRPLQSGRKAPLTGAARRWAGPRPCAPAPPLSAACCSCPPPSPPACGHSTAGWGGTGTRRPPAALPPPAAPGRLPPGSGALRGGDGQRQPRPAAPAHLSASGHFSPRQARIPPAASRVIVSLAGGETHGCSRRAAAGLAEAAAAPPGCHTAGSALPPREGPAPAGGCSQAAAAAAVPASPGPGGRKRPRSGERSAPHPWLLPAGAKSCVSPSTWGCREDGLLGGAMSSGEADPTAREEMRLLPAQ